MKSFVSVRQRVDRGMTLNLGARRPSVFVLTA